MAKREEKNIHRFKVEDKEPPQVDRRQVDPTRFIVEQVAQVPLPEGFYIFSLTVASSEDYGGR